MPAFDRRRHTCVTADRGIALGSLQWIGGSAQPSSIAGRRAASLAVAMYAVKAVVGAKGPSKARD